MYQIYLLIILVLVVAFGNCKEDKKDNKFLLLCAAAAASSGGGGQQGSGGGGLETVATPTFSPAAGNHKLAFPILPFLLLLQVLPFTTLQMEQTLLQVQLSILVHL